MRLIYLITLFDLVAQCLAFKTLVRTLCWDKNEKIEGLDPNIWRIDWSGGLVNRYLMNCDGAFCYRFFRVVPKKVGISELDVNSLDNCEILQTTVAKSLMKKKKSGEISEINTESARRERHYLMSKYPQLGIEASWFVGIAEAYEGKSHNDGYGASKLEYIDEMKKNHMTYTQNLDLSSKFFKQLATCKIAPSEKDSKEKIMEGQTIISSRCEI